MKLFSRLLLAILIASSPIAFAASTNTSGIAVYDFEITCSQDKMVKAQFPGGEEKLKEWLRENMDYPEGAKRFGTVIVRFMVKKNGKLSDFVIQKGVQESLDVAAIEILRGMPKWEPAVKDGKAIDSMVQLPVKFVPKKEK